MVKLSTPDGSLCPPTTETMQMVQGLEMIIRTRGYLRKDLCISCEIPCGLLKQEEIVIANSRDFHFSMQMKPWLSWLIANATSYVMFMVNLCQLIITNTKRCCKTTTKITSLLQVSKLAVLCYLLKYAYDFTFYIYLMLISKKYLKDIYYHVTLVRAR